MDNENTKQKVSLIGRLFSMETFLFLMGWVFFVSGFYRDEPAQYFWGIMIVGGSIALHFVRKKDWKKHWEEQEQQMLQHKARQEREKMRRAASSELPAALPQDKEQGKGINSGD